MWPLIKVLPWRRALAAEFDPFVHQSNSKFSTCFKHRSGGADCAGSPASFFRLCGGADIGLYPSGANDGFVVSSSIRCMSGCGRQPPPDARLSPHFYFGEGQKAPEIDRTGAP